MTQTSHRFNSLLAIGLLAGVGIGIATASVPSAVAETAQAPTCSWKRAGIMSFESYFGAGAVDVNENKLYVFGGVDDAGNVNDTMSSIDYSAAAAPDDGTVKNEGRGLKKRYGAAAAYVPNSDAAMKGSIYFIGGAEDIGTDTTVTRGENDAIMFDIETGNFSIVTTSGRDLGERIFHAAAYDPTNDMIVTTGGVGNCSMVDDLAGCGNADTYDTLFMKFTDTGVEVEAGPAGGPNRTYGHTMVYDSTGNRMIAFGGTRAGSRGVTDLWELPLADLATASWNALSSSGSAPALAFHTAAYDSANNNMLVHGGATSEFFLGAESTARNTRALDLGDASGTARWMDLGATSNPPERLGGVGGFINTATLTGMVMATGRSKFDGSGDVTGQNPTRNSELLVCEDAVPTTPPPATTTPPPVTTPPPGTTPATPTPVTPTVPPVVGADACPNLDTKVPASVIAAALGSPDSVSGWMELCNPSLPPSIWNTQRHHLSLRNSGLPYHPLYNGVVYKCGCP